MTTSSTAPAAEPRVDLPRVAFGIFAGIVFVWALLASAFPFFGRFMDWNTIAEPDDFRTFALIFFALLVASFVDGPAKKFHREMLVGVGLFFLAILSLALNLLDGALYELFSTLVLLGTIVFTILNNRSR